MSTAGISANKLELLQIARAVADEKSIPKEVVLGAIEEAIQKAAKMRYGSELDIRAKLRLKMILLKLTLPRQRWIILML